jgi:HD superfamily phosphohydrolase YqeK
MDKQEKVDIFKDELNSIEREDIREFTKYCIGIAPDYVFFECPSSSSGKHHCVEELGGDGTVIHTRKIFYVVDELVRAWDVVKYRDIVLAAALLHDLAKQGNPRNYRKHTVKDHPQIMAEMVNTAYHEAFVDVIDYETVAAIYSCIFFHYGPWTLKKNAKPMSEYSVVELLVYTADYISSRRAIHVDYKNRGA